LLEGSLIVLLIVLLVHTLLWKLAVPGVLSLLLGFMVLGMLLAPLWTRHQRSHDTLYLRCGRSSRVAIPRMMIRATQPVDERLSPLQLLGGAMIAGGDVSRLAFPSMGKSCCNLHNWHFLKLALASMSQTPC
jgi:hypothetical protein